MNDEIDDYNEKVEEHNRMMEAAHMKWPEAVFKSFAVIGLAACVCMWLYTGHEIDFITLIVICAFATTILGVDVWERIVAKFFGE